MLKNITFFAVVVVVGLLSGRLSAQSFAVTPAPVMHVTADLKTITIFDVYQENTTTDTIALGWRKLKLDVPAAWDYSMCELGRCYAGIPDSSEMDAVAPGDKAFLGLNIIPNGVAGSGSCVCYVFDTRYPDKGDTITWFVTAANASVPVTTTVQAFAVTPNPSTGLFELRFGTTFIGDVQIFNAAGKQITSYAANGISVKLDLASQPAGTYWISTRSKSGERQSVKIVRE